MYLVLFVLLLLVSPPLALGANILGVFSITSISHQVVYRTLTLELNKRGHNLTVITPDPINDPSLKNYREIDMSFYYDIYREKILTNPKELRLGMKLPEFVYLIFTQMSNDMCSTYFSSPQVLAFIKENPRFDLVITEFGFNPCFYGFAKFSGFKQIGIFSFQANTMVHSNMGNPADASYVQDVNFPYISKMNFCQRLRTWIFQSFTWLIYAYTMITQTTIARTYLGDDLPHLMEIDRNLSAMMVNTHFTMSQPRPYLPNFLEIGGPAFHLIGRKPKPLPKNARPYYMRMGEGVNQTVRDEKLLIDGKWQKS